MWSTRKLVTKSECRFQNGNRDFGEPDLGERRVSLWKDGVPTMARSEMRKIENPRIHRFPPKMNRGRGISAREATNVPPLAFVTWQTCKSTFVGTPCRDVSTSHSAMFGQTSFQIG